MKKLNLIRARPGVGQDRQAPLITDWRSFNSMIVQLFHDQPLTLRKIAPLVLPVTYDGKTTDEIPTLNDIGRPDYKMEPALHDAIIDGASIIAKIPQIYQTATLSNDKWAMLFAGRSRLPLTMGQMMRKIKIEEEIQAYQGYNNLGIEGIINDAGSATDIGASAGKWDVEDNSDGILSHAHEDINKGLDDFTANGLGDLPVDVILTSYAFNLLKNTFLSRAPNMNNLDLVRNKLNGGRIYVTNNIQAPKTTVDADTNSMIMMARGSPAEPGWVLYSAGLDQMQHKQGWSTTYGIREKFAYKLLDNKFIRWMNEIDTTT